MAKKKDVQWGPTEHGAHCPHCQTGKKTSSRDQSQAWADQHNSVKHRGGVPAAGWHESRQEKR